jgi:uncharacterized protein (DUF2164 family)
LKKIEFSKEERRAIAARLQRYFADELDHKLGDLPAELLLDFLADEIGPAFYNRGLYDAQALVAARLEELGDAILTLEQRGR